MAAVLARVRYQERQRLLSADLLAEQAYRLGLAGRHHLGPHRWGVIQGLQLVQGGTGWILNPGLAIDGYGREIVVPQPVRLRDVDADQCVAVLLYYCEYPEQLEPVRCIEQPAPRVGHRFRIVPSPEFVPVATESDLASGRAAGVTPGLAPWPILIGKVGSACFNLDGTARSPFDEWVVRYASHRAGAVRSPTGRAVMQLGPSGGKDVYHFLLSTRNDGGALEKRLGIDRDDLVRVWRPLVIVGATGAGEAQVSAQASIRFEGPMPAGPAPRMLIEGRFDRKTGVLTSLLVESGAVRSVTPLVTKLQLEKPSSAVLKFANGRTARVQLLAHPEAAPPIVQSIVALEGPQPESLLEKFSIEMKPVGGALVMLRRETAGEEIPAPECGDVERVRATRKTFGPPVVQFRNGAGLAANPLMREIHAVTVESNDLVPRMQLRVSGGVEDDKDPGRRLSVGDRRTGGWSPALTMNGWGKLVMGRPPEPNASDQPILKVKGVVYLPPVGKNDPLLADLMAQAFIAGLLQMGQVSADVTLEFLDLPETIVNTEDFDYKLRVTRQAGSQVVKIKRCLEIITALGSGDTVVASVTGLPAELNDFGPHDTTVDHRAFTIEAEKVRIEILLLVGIGTATRAVTIRTGNIPVVEPEPSIV